LAVGLHLIIGCAHATAQNTFSVAAKLKVACVDYSTTLLPDGNILVAGGYAPASGSALKPLNTAEIFNPVLGTWTATGSLITARFNHTATLLPNGEVLVAGGQVGADGVEPNLASAELYNPVTGTWTATGTMLNPHTDHTATLLPSGQVLVAGGLGSTGATTATELYNPATGSWTQTGSLNAPRAFHTATLLASGQLLAAGGNGNPGALASAELYDPVAGMWTYTGSLNTAREYHTATLLPNGQVLAAGGGPSKASSYASAELYDPAQGTWSLTGTLNHAREFHTASLLPNGQVLAAGGLALPDFSSTAELYDPGQGTWTLTSGTLGAAIPRTATVLPSGQVMLVDGLAQLAELYGSAVPTLGGANADPSNFSTHTLLPTGAILVTDLFEGSGDAYLFDPATGSVSATGTMAVNGIYRFTQTLLSDGRVLVAGGYFTNSSTHYGESTGSAQVYDPVSGTWTLTGSMNTPRWDFVLTLLRSGQVLATPGRQMGNGLNTYLPQSELYDPVAGTWSNTGRVNTMRDGETATLLPDGQVLMVGGIGTNGSPLASAELYDPVLGVWKKTGSLGIGRYQHTATLLPSGKVLVVGGFTGSASVSATELYDPATGTWSPAAPLDRTGHGATLLRSGKVVVAGGGSSVHGSTPYTPYSETYDPALNTWTADTTVAGAGDDISEQFLLPDGRVFIDGGEPQIYDPGLGFNSASQPQIVSATSPLLSGSELALTGSNFMGLSGGSGGNTYDSSSGVPVVQLMSLVNQQTIYLTPDPKVSFSGTSFQSLPVTGLPSGFAMATVFANGIPSAAFFVQIPPAPLPFAVTGTGSVPGTSSTFAPAGPPSVGTFLGVEQTGSVSTSTIFSPDGTPLVQKSGTVSGLVVAALTDPSGDADIVTLGTGGGVTAASDMALVVGLSSSNPVIAAQTGTAEPGLPAGVMIKKFLSIDGNGADTFFLATLEGTGINSANSTALCAVEPGDTINVAAQTGDSLLIGGTNKTVSLITTLATSPGTVDQERYRVGDTAFGMRTTFTDKSQAIFTVPAASASGTNWSLIATTGTISAIAPLNGTVAASFGLPAFSADTGATLIHLTLNKGGVTSANSLALVGGTLGGSLNALARTGASPPDENGAPMPGIVFKTLSDPVTGGSGSVAFEATISGAGVTTASDVGIWYAPVGASPSLLARTGTGAQALAPGGGHWSRFESMVLPDDPLRGPIFIAALATRAADGVSTANNLGIWAVDSTGALDLLLRTGDNAGNNIIHDIVALVPATGSPGAANGYDDNGDVAALVTFTTGAQEVVVLQVP